MTKPLNPEADANDLVHLTYRRIRKMIGYLGISMPIVLVFLSLIPFFKTEIAIIIIPIFAKYLRGYFAP